MLRCADVNDVDVLACDQLEGICTELAVVEAGSIAADLESVG
jgi:hypothetical protein